MGPTVGWPPTLGQQLPVQLLEPLPLSLQPGTLGADVSGDGRVPGNVAPAMA